MKAVLGGEGFQEFLFLNNRGTLLTAELCVFIQSSGQILLGFVVCDSILLFFGRTVPFLHLWQFEKCECL
jgi:hypothetical protein